MDRRMKLKVAYFGQSFHGWQRQRGQRTVQGDLEIALRKLFQGREVKTVGAGRTDAGVHAAGQVVHLEPPDAIPANALVRALNSRLSPDIRVRSARIVTDSFHARTAALGKLYVYRARWSSPTLPWIDLLSATVPKTVDSGAFTAAINLLSGRHDWASFTVPDPETTSTIRTLFRVRLHHRRDGFNLEFIGDGFLRYQVRRMVGSLLEVGSGKRRLRDMEDLIDCPQPGAPIRTAPACGLCLEHVYYKNCPAVAR